MKITSIASYINSTDYYGRGIILYPKYVDHIVFTDEILESEI